MELTFLKIPCIIAGNPPYTALNLNYAGNKEQYFHMIAQAHTLQVTDEQKIEAAKYLYLLENKHVNINCIAYNKNLKKFHWDRKALKRYLNEGNREIESVVDNMLA
jgi:DNA invertase Pin-like site-specific DNA recombinase